MAEQVQPVDIAPPVMTEQLEAPDVKITKTTPYAVYVEFSHKHPTKVAKYHLEILNKESQEWVKTNATGTVQVEMVVVNLVPNTKYSFRAYVTGNDNVRGTTSQVLFATTTKFYPISKTLHDVNLLRSKCTEITRLLVDGKIPVTRFRFAVTGPFGSGKSATINSTTSVCGCPAGAPSNNKSEHVTRLVKSYSAVSFGTLEHYHYEWIDVPGWDTTGANYENVLGDYAKGRIQDGYDMTQTGGVNFDDPHFNKTPSFEDVPTSFVAIFDANSATNGEQLELLSKFRDRLIQMGYSLVIVVTKMDEIDKDLVDDLSNLYDSSIVMNIMKIIWDKTHTDIHSCFPVVNYLSEQEERCDIKDFLALNLLKTLYDSSKNFVERRSKERTVPPAQVSTGDFIYVNSQSMKYKIPILCNIQEIKAEVFTKTKMTEIDFELLDDDNIVIDDIVDLEHGKVYTIKVLDTN